MGGADPNVAALKGRARYSLSTLGSRRKLGRARLLRGTAPSWGLVLPGGNAKLRGSRCCSGVAARGSGDVREEKDERAYH